MIDVDADIIPWVGIAGLKLGESIYNYKSIIDESDHPGFLLGKYFIKYQFNEAIEIWCNILNGKVFKIVALSNYKGRLWDEITIGMDFNKLNINNRKYIYDENEEVYVFADGVIIETEPETNRILWISVFVKEMLLDDFESTNF